MQVDPNPIIQLRHYDPIPLERLNLPLDILFRPFKYSSFASPSLDHAECAREIEIALIPIIGKLACRKLIDWTIRHHLLILAPDRPGNGVYCSTPGAIFRGIGFSDGRTAHATTDVGFYYQTVSPLLISFSFG